MKRATRIVLIAGSALILALELPRTLADLVDAWHGPYASGPSAADSQRVALR